MAWNSIQLHFCPNSPSIKKRPFEFVVYVRNPAQCSGVNSIRFLNQSLSSLRYQPEKTTRKTRVRIRAVFGPFEKRFPGLEKITRKEPRKAFGPEKFSGLLRNARQGRVGRKPVNANPRFKVNRGNDFSSIKMVSAAYVFCSLRFLMLKIEGQKM